MEFEDYQYVSAAFYFNFSIVNFAVAFLIQKINGSGTRVNESDPPHKNEKAF